MTRLGGIDGAIHVLVVAHGPPMRCISAITCKVRVVLPDDSGP